LKTASGKKVVSANYPQSGFLKNRLALEKYSSVSHEVRQKSADKMRTLLAVQHPNGYNANQLALASVLLVKTAETPPRKELATQSTR